VQKSAHYTHNISKFGSPIIDADNADELFQGCWLIQTIDISLQVVEGDNGEKSLLRTIKIGGKGFVGCNELVKFS
jgi:hypothetical protein